MSDRHELTECGICHAPAGVPCDYDGEHIGRRWKIEPTSPATKLTRNRELVADGGRCRPTVESNHLLLTPDELKPGEVDRCGPIIYRGACLGCGWHGGERDCDNDAVDDAHDHAAPGWRELPPVPRHPSSSGDHTGAAAQKAHEVWLDKVARLYAAHGVDARWLPGAGAPIRTYRTTYGTRSHWSSPIDGYDMSAGLEPAHVDYSPQLTLFG